MTDPIADMIIRIKNAVLAKRKQVSIPHSKINEAIAKIFKDNNYIESYEVEKKVPQSELIVTLKYIDKDSVLSGVKRLSKPGRRLYSTVGKTPKTLSGYGVTILSTNKGLMTDKEARKLNVGGELICSIW